MPEWLLHLLLHRHLHFHRFFELQLLLEGHLSHLLALKLLLLVERLSLYGCHLLRRHHRLLWRNFKRHCSESGQGWVVDEGLDLLIVDFLTIFVLVIAHHEEVSLEFLLLSRVKLTFLWLTALIIFSIAFVIEVLVLLRVEVLLNPV